MSCMVSQFIEAALTCDRASAALKHCPSPQAIIPAMTIRYGCSEPIASRSRS